MTSRMSRRCSVGSFAAKCTKGCTRSTSLSASVALAILDDAIGETIILLVSDINMPGMSGFQVCEAIRRRSRVPVMMLTVRGEEEDLVRALGLGADDYLNKPFSPRTLLARIKALLRRAGMENNSPLAAGRISLDLEEYTVSIGGGVPIRLTKLELRLLQMLLANAGRVLPRETLIDRVWGTDYVGDTKTLDVHVKRLRAKVEPDPSSPTRIVTIRGLGYKYDVPRV